MIAHLASLSLERGLQLPARAFVQRFLAGGPPTPEVLLLGVQVETALGDAEAAGGYRQQLLERFPDSPQAAQIGAAQGPGK